MNDPHDNAADDREMLHRYTPPDQRARERERSDRKALSGLPYRREADDLIHLVFESGYNSTRRTRAVADYLAERFQYRTPTGPDHAAG